MRMWMVQPEIMCKNHLLGEHREIHMMAGYINNHHKIGRYKYLIEVQSLLVRHNQLVQEMNKRGYQHNTPLPDIDLSSVKPDEFVKIDQTQSLNILLGRCKDCRMLYMKTYNLTPYYAKLEELVYQQPNVNTVKDRQNRYQINNALQLIEHLTNI